MNFRNNKGVTLLALVITVIILTIITSTIIYNSRNSISMKKLNQLYQDIETLSSKIDAYYLENEELPVICKYLDKKKLQEHLDYIANGKGKQVYGELNKNDGEDEYYVIDLEKLDGLNLNYGYDSQYEDVKKDKKINEEDEISLIVDEMYIINKITHEIYFPHGIIVNNYMYFKNNDSSVSGKIDEILPEMDDISEVVTPRSDGFYIDVTFNDSVKRPTKILIKEETSSPQGDENEWEDINGQNKHSKKIANNYTGVNNTTYYVWVKDANGTISKDREIKTEKLHWLVVDGNMSIADTSVNITYGRYYNNIGKSVRRAKNGEKVILLDNENYVDNSTVSVNRMVTIDLNGKTLKHNEPINVEKTGNLTIVDGVGKIKNNSTKLVYNGGKLTIGSAVIPKGFSIPNDGTFAVSEGIVVEDNVGSQFVWVPVPTAVSDTEANATTNKAMAINLGTEENPQYRGLLYNFSVTTSTVKSGCTTTTSDFREPAYLTDSSYADASSYNTIGITQESLQAEYNAMIKSVKDNGGFYVGRYETSLNGETIASKGGVAPTSAANSNTNMWYGLYKSEKEYAEKVGINSVVGSSMIWGSQYDAMLNWALNGKDNTKVTAKGNGNHDGSVVNTGTTTNDKINNIFDLEGNMWEWTQEAYSTYFRVERGGNYYHSLSPASRYDDFPYTTNSNGGSRLALYVK